VLRFCLCVCVHECSYVFLILPARHVNAARLHIELVLNKLVLVPVLSIVVSCFSVRRVPRTIQTRIVRSLNHFEERSSSARVVSENKVVEAGGEFKSEATVPDICVRKVTIDKQIQARGESTMSQFGQDCFRSYPFRSDAIHTTVCETGTRTMPTMTLPMLRRCGMFTMESDPSLDHLPESHLRFKNRLLLNVRRLAGWGEMFWRCLCASRPGLQKCDFQPR
jgi:hypothetical protein